MSCHCQNPRIAEAVAAERERCLKIARDAIGMLGPLASTPAANLPIVQAWDNACRQIAQGIEGGA